MTLVELVISGEPVPKGRPRVVDNRAYTPERTKAAEAKVAWSMRDAYRGAPLLGPLSVEAWFYARTARRADIDNFGKLLLDSGNGVVWLDDAQVVDLTLHKRVDRKWPRTELQVREAK